MQTEHSPFPTDETLAAYIDGRLDEETRKQVIAHMAECADCLDVLTVNREMNLAPVVRGVNWRRRLVAGLAVAAVAAGVVSLTPIRDRFWPHDDIRALAAVAPAQRVIDGRLTGFPYRPLKRYRGGDKNDITSNPEYWSFLAVADKVQQRAVRNPNPRARHAEGVSYLVVGYTRESKMALEDALLRETRQSDVARAIAASSDPQLLSDLAAAYLAANRPSDALNAAERAWSLSRTPEIAWNRAYAAQSLQHREQAITNWRDYLRLDDKSQWADAASEQLRRLEHPDAPIE
jgi:hypothetical protein